MCAAILHFITIPPAPVRAAVHPGDCLRDGEEYDSVCLCDSALRLLDFSERSGCAGHLEVQVLL